MKGSNQYKLKVRTNNKAYAVQDSPFYKLGSKRKLSELLGIELKELKSMAEDNSGYKVFSQKNEKGKIREIQQPFGKLDFLHTRIASLLSRVKPPDYIHSGRKGHSHISNAKQHVGRLKVLTSDLTKFFPSTSRKMVFDLFRCKFRMNSDVVDLLSKISCFSDHVPTGSRLSMPLAFWANEVMFNELHLLADKHGCTMSLYVDDLTFSGVNVNKLFLNTVLKIVERNGHRLHPKKTKLFRSDEEKVITGVVVGADGVSLKRIQHQNIHIDLEMWQLLAADKLKVSSLQSRLLGRLWAASQIDPKFKDKALSVLSS